MEGGALIVSALPVMGVAVEAVLERCGYAGLGRLTYSDRLASQVRTTAPALVLVDLGLPGVVPAVRRLCARPDRPAVLLLAGDEHDGDVVGLVCAGAVGAVPRAVSPETLERVLLAVRAGELVVPRHLVSRVITELRRGVAADAGPRMPVLTRREQQVLDMLRAGFSTSAIAERLVVEPVTVRSHVCAIRRKLRLDDVAFRPVLSAG